jgi:hypothetical protein
MIDLVPGAGVPPLPCVPEIPTLERHHMARLSLTVPETSQFGADPGQIPRTSERDSKLWRALTAGRMATGGGKGQAVQTMSWKIVIIPHPYSRI